MELRIILKGNKHEWHAQYLIQFPQHLSMDMRTTIPHGRGRTPLDALRRLVEGTKDDDMKRLFPSQHPEK